MPSSIRISHCLKMSATKVLGLVLLNSYFSSMTNVSYTENGRCTACERRNSIAAKASPVKIVPWPKLRAAVSIMLKPPRTMKAIVMPANTVSATTSNLTFSRRYV